MEGYTSALIGVYQLLSDAYTPSSFMMGSGVDALANIYAAPSYSFSPSLNSCYYYDFEDTQLDAASGTVFLQLYKTLANVNVILENIATEDGLTDEEYRLIKGEALALRAFIHFDLWRLYGTMPGDETGIANTILPYALHATNDPHTYVNYTDYFAYLVADLETGRDLLAQSDPIVTYSNELLNTEGSIEAYEYLGWYNRQKRLNYYATLGILARVALWMGNHEQAYAYALEIIQATDDDGSEKFPLGTATNLGNQDYALFVEQLFGIETENYDDDAYATYYGYCVNSESVIQTVYPSTSDIRRVNLFATLVNNALVYNAQISKKYSLMSEDDVSSYKSFPILRTAEIYLILVECAPTLSESQMYYDQFINTRYDQNVTLDESNLEQSVLNQYTREFWGEGQIFYAYKRLNILALPLSSQEMTADKYQIDLPTGETSGGL